ncbi:hypothetical protein [Sphingomonas sp.]|jgi:hypothetical protein|uniref:hypothetical protein n=1 Tax=Sphingomonas sp. TaxID=28214 RepID=UPI002ED866B5
MTSFSFPHLFAFALCAGTPVAAFAQTSAAQEYEINGFRHTAFGMSEAEARAAIGVDFPGTTIADASNTAEGTKLLQVSLATLEPGPGSATVTYIFGAKSKALTTVKLAWLLPPSATPAERAAVLAAGLQLAAYFQNLKPQPRLVAPPKVTGIGAVSLYAAVDRKNAAVEVAANGVDTESNQGAVPTGPAILRVTYVANAGKPDVLVRVKTKDSN